MWRRAPTILPAVDRAPRPATVERQHRTSIDSPDGITAVCQSRLQCVNSLSVAVLLGWLSGACAPTPTGFDVTRARAHLDMLAGTIGSRPAGSPANVRARAYIVDQLTAMGFAVRVQDAIAVNPQFGVSTRVANVIAVRDGARRDAIALVSHYDSVPEASGAIDNGIGVATSLEAARVLAESGLAGSLMVLVTDGEELGLMGARVLVRDEEIVARMRAFLNFDNTGASGSSLLFEVHPGLSGALEAWASAAVAPSGASFAIEIYKRLPNDTDFTILKATGAAGLNFAVVGDAYAYHTDRDVAARVQSSTLQRGGENAVAIVRALDKRGLDAGSLSPTYFDIAGWRGVAYGPGVTRALVWVACLLASLAWLLLTRDVWRARRLWGVVATLGWAVIAALGIVASTIGAAWVLRSARTELNPWYAAPQWYFLWIGVAGLAAAVLVAKLSSIVPARLQPTAGPAAIWWAAIPLWMALIIALQLAAPAASYLFSIPLLAAGVFVLAGRRSPRSTRIGSTAVLLIVALIAGSKVLLLMAFVVPLFGWLPVAVPIWLHPGLVVIAAILFGPPIAAMIAGQPQRRRSWLVPLGLAVALVASAVLAYTAPAYTADRPERRLARYIQDDSQHQAWFEVGGPEPAVRLGPAGPDGAAWALVDLPLPTSVLPGRLDTAFAFRTPTRPLVTTLPAEIRSAISKDERGRPVLEVVVTPREYVAAQFVLPLGFKSDPGAAPPPPGAHSRLAVGTPIVPIESSLAGRVIDGRWRATFVAPPAEGLTVRFAFAAEVAAEALAGASVVLTSRGLPGGSGPLNLPAWLPQERATWRARSVFIVPVK
jgi:hypothetical protein